MAGPSTPSKPKVTTSISDDEPPAERKSDSKIAMGFSKSLRGRGLSQASHSSISFSEAQLRRASLKAEAFNKSRGTEALISKELGEGFKVRVEKERLEASAALENELELTPFVIKVQRAFRLVKFVYKKFGPLLFKETQSRAAYGQIKFREVLKPASWIAVAPNVSARRLVKFMDYYWELPKPEGRVSPQARAHTRATPKWHAHRHARKHVHTVRPTRELSMPNCRSSCDNHWWGARLCLSARFAHGV